MPHALHQEKIKQANRGRQVMLERPGFDRGAGGNGCDEYEREPHSAIAKQTGQRQKRQGKSRAHEEYPERSCAVTQAVQESMQGCSSLISPHFKIGVELAHYSMVIDGFGPRL